MADPQRLLNQCYLSIKGAPAPLPLMGDLEQVSVESSLHLPDVATLVLHDPRLAWLDDDLLAPGAALSITMRSGGSEALIFDGEIVELEPEFGASAQRLMVRAFDRLHRLARVRKVRAFQNVNESDMIRRLADEVGLDARVAPTRVIHPYVLQANVTNLAFLQERAAMLGYLLYVEGDTLHCEPPPDDDAPLALAWGENLLGFHPRLTTVAQVQQVVARGWDPLHKQVTLGQAKRGRGAPEVGDRRSGGQVAKAAFNLPDSEHLVADRPLPTQALAQQLAQAVADRIAGRFIEADGVCGGMVELVAGARVELRAVGERFSGVYFVTSATHVYDADGTYTTRFTVSGLNSATLLGLLLPEREAAPGGLVIGVVTDNADPEGLGRVRVRYPWLADNCASAWARVVAPGGGNERGVQFLPEIDDEVLIGFEQGDMNAPYVLGGLWNGVDMPAMPGVVRNNRVQQRVIRSRSGHTITLDDSDNGGRISIQDSQGNQIVLDTGSNALSIKSGGDISITAGGNLTLAARGTVSVEGMGITIDGQSATVDVKATMINLN